MSDTDDTGLVIASKPGGFLEVAPNKWVRWDRIDNVEAHDDELRVYGRSRSWAMGCGTRQMALAWADALFAAIERERAIELGLPLHLSPKSAGQLYRDWQAMLANRGRAEVRLEPGCPLRVWDFAAVDPQEAGVPLRGLDFA